MRQQSVCTLCTAAQLKRSTSAEEGAKECDGVFKKGGQISPEHLCVEERVPRASHWRREICKWPRLDNTKHQLKNSHFQTLVVHFGARVDLLIWLRAEGFSDRGAAAVETSLDVLPDLNDRL